MAEQRGVGRQRGADGGARHLRLRREDVVLQRSAAAQRGGDADRELHGGDQAGAGVLDLGRRTRERLRQRDAWRFRFVLDGVRDALQRRRDPA